MVLRAAQVNMAEYPDHNDNDFALWLKIAHNLREAAVSVGEVGMPEITTKENIFSLQRKITVYTAALAT